MNWLFPQDATFWGSSLCSLRYLRWMSKLSWINHPNLIHHQSKSSSSPSKCSMQDQCHPCLASAGFFWMVRQCKVGEVLAATPCIHSPGLPWSCHTGHSLLLELACLCAIYSKGFISVRFPSSISVSDISLATTGCTPAGCRPHQVSSHWASHLSRAANPWLLLSNLTPWWKIWLMEL